MELKAEIVEAIDIIKRDTTHGASELARQAVGVIKRSAQVSSAPDASSFIAEIRTTEDQLMTVRPAMASIYNSVRALMDSLLVQDEDGTVEELRQRVIAEADRLIDESRKAVAQIAGHVSSIIEPDDVIMTLSYSSTVLEALQEAHRKKGNLGIILPLCGRGQIEVETAKKLAKAGIKVTLLEQCIMGVGTERCSRVIAGADRICRDGALVNAAGTFPLAKMACEAGKPFVALCETAKFDKRLNGCEAELEEKVSLDMFLPGILPPFNWKRTPTFDVTPLELITNVITERCVLTRAEVMPYIDGLPG